MIVVEKQTNPKKERKNFSSGRYPYILSVIYTFADKRLSMRHSNLYQEGWSLPTECLIFHQSPEVTDLQEDV